MSDVNTLTVLVLDSKKQFLEYTHPAIARKLVKNGYAFVFTEDPFTIKLSPIVSVQLSQGKIRSVSALVYK